MAISSTESGLRSHRRLQTIGGGDFISKVKVGSVDCNRLVTFAEKTFKEKTQVDCVRHRHQQPDREPKIWFTLANRFTTIMIVGEI
ncbi:hypothetical protein L484_011504 [Morus notabilis]|uniref:Uncharacterized protein n=1 Tax=Morus notabilis TaxID=981085 RepID=W9RH64_9ROSA|nr:hypothetical protein L484_011504 [Morus notabilis]